MSMSRLEAFIRYLEEQVANHSVYVWGAQGQKNLTEAWIRKRETSTENANRAVSFWKKQVSAGYGEVLRAFDCSGLGMYYLQNLTGILQRDTTADGLYSRCRRIEKKELQTGDFVFKVNAEGKATHIGYVVDRDLNVIEAQGRAYGVVKRPFSKGKWQAYGRPPFWIEEEQKIREDNAEPFVFHRELKHGCQGEDVCALKRLLVKAGFTELDVTNQNYFGNTKRAVRAFQQRVGFLADGVADKKTILALGGRMEG